MKRLFLRCGIFDALVNLVFIAGIAATVQADSAVDHLLPIDDKLGVASYRKLWKEKLLLTPGDVARVVLLPGNAGEETSVSLYRDIHKDGGLPGGYWITFTQASTSLWECISARDRSGIDPASVNIRRLDVPISTKTATAIHDLWYAMLRRTESSANSHAVFLDSTTKIFSVVGPQGTLRGEMPKGQSGPMTTALSAIAGSLIEYSTMPPELRGTKEREIQEATLALLSKITQKR